MLVCRYQEMRLPNVKDQLKKAVKLKQQASRDMKIAASLEALGETGRAAEFHVEAIFNSAAADELMQVTAPPPVVAGEVLPTEAQRADGEGGWALRDTLACPDAASIAASLERTDLLTQGHTGVLALGVDAAESVGVSNSLEKMLAHQMALAHKAAFQLVEKALEQRDPIELARLMNASARMMSTYQQALITLHRIRSKGQQTITVQHVTVSGGQAVVAGHMQTGGRSLATGGRNQKS
jgi:hypothetical protein